MTLPPAVRWTIRRALALVLPRLPAALRTRATRLAFSRYARALPGVLGGNEVIDWNGIRLTVDPGETSGFWMYFFSAESDDLEFEWLREVTAGARIFADVGAHAGLYALALARQHRHLRAIAFEPSAPISQWLRENVALNPDVSGRIVVERVAVSDVDGEVSFQDAGGPNSAVGHVISNLSERATARVPAVTLTSYFKDAEPPDVIKIDVEGHEHRVLIGMDGLPRLPQAILIELHAPLHGAPDQREAVLDWLQSHAYQSTYLIEDVRIQSECPQPLPDRLHILACRDTRVPS